MNRERLTAYWGEKAQHFPRPSQEKELAQSNRIIAHVERMGVQVAGTRMLEIGCGTGLITIPLARKADRVTALDLSGEMLAILAEEMTYAGLNNVELRQCSWQAVDPFRDELHQSCDSVWTVRSTAVTNAEDLHRMELCAKTWCVFAGADAIRRVPVMESILAFHGIPSILSPSAAEVFVMVQDRGRTPVRDTILLAWNREGTVEAMIQDVTAHIEVYGVTPQRAMIEEALRSHSSDGMIRLHQEVDLGLVAWRVDC